MCNLCNLHREMQKVYKRSHSSILCQEGGSTIIRGQDPIQQNFAETLPTEMSVRIFSELDLKSLCWASLTCKRWNGIIEDNDYLWRNQCLTVLAICRREVDGDRQNGYSWKVCVIASCSIKLLVIDILVYNIE